MRRVVIGVLALGLFGGWTSGCKSGDTGETTTAADEYDESARQPRKKKRPRPKEQPERKEAKPSDADFDSGPALVADVETGSYAFARRKLDGGKMPPASAVRAEEFLNYFSYAYSDPDSGPLGVGAEVAPSPFASEDDRYLMRVGVQGKNLGPKDRTPIHLTLLVDNSQSFEEPDTLEWVKKSVQDLLDGLQEGDTVAVAAYAGRRSNARTTVLEPTDIEERERILSSFDRVESHGGGQGLKSGLEGAYRLASKSGGGDGTHHVLVLSEGDAGLEDGARDEVFARVETFADTGVALSALDFGARDGGDTVMERLSDYGDGNDYRVDSVDEARKVLGERVRRSLQVVAKDVRVQVEFDDDAVTDHRLIGYAGRDEGVDVGALGAGQTVTLLYELETAGAPEEPATVRVRYKEPEASEPSEQTLSVQAAEIREASSEASDDFRFAAAVAGFAQKLADSPRAEDLSWKRITEVAAGAVADRAERETFVDLVDKARGLE